MQSGTMPKLFNPATKQYEDIRKQYSKQWHRQQWKQIHTHDFFRRTTYLVYTG
jgi:hypothetical protein